nr:multidrug resistance protein 1 [Quercus suber]
MLIMKLALCMCIPAASDSGVQRHTGQALLIAGSEPRYATRLTPHAAPLQLSPVFPMRPCKSLSRQILDSRGRAGERFSFLENGIRAQRPSPRSMWRDSQTHDRRHATLVSALILSGLISALAGLGIMDYRMATTAGNEEEFIQMEKWSPTADANYRRSLDSLSSEELTALPRFAVVYLGNVCITIAALRTVRAIRKRFLETTLRQEVWHFDKHASGSIATQGIAEKLTTVIQGLSLFISSFIVALSVQWKLALITMTVIPAIFIVASVCVAIDAKQEARIVRIYSQAAALAQEAISSIKTVHAFWAQDKMTERYDELLSEAHREARKKSPNFAVVLSVQYFLGLAVTALAFWEGFRLYEAGEVHEVGNVLTVLLSVVMGATAISSIAPQIQSITNAGAAASELFEVIEKKSLLDPLSTEGRQPLSCRGQVEIRGLDFAYPSRPSAQILHSLDLSVPAGKTTALVGASGCGKSTIIALLERWYEPAKGQILLDGVDLADYNTKWLRSNIRLVQQEPVLFRGTVFENIAKGFVGAQQELSEQEQRKLVEEACKNSNAHDFIRNLPEGYDTQVGERASMLSGGQKQRIAIARSIISDPKILLLDEATSALEKIVQEALNRVSENKTTLVIAHKLATVKAADNIVVMSYGKVVEQGTHVDLIARDGQYAALVRAQDLGHAQYEPEYEVPLRPGNPRRSTKLSRMSTRDSRRQSQRWSTFLPGLPPDPPEEEKVEPELGTLNLGLVRCIWIMLAEQKDLYGWFALAVGACFICGGVYPAQAVLFSRLIQVFELSGEQQRKEANFNALMLFIVSVVCFFAYGAIGWVCNEVRCLPLRFRHPANDGSLGWPNCNSPLSCGNGTSDAAFGPRLLRQARELVRRIDLEAVISAQRAPGIDVGQPVPDLDRRDQSGRVCRPRHRQWMETWPCRRVWRSALPRLATEVVSSIRTVSSLTLESQICAQYGELLDGIVRSVTRATLGNMVLYALSQSLDFLIMALGFWYGSTLIASGEYTVQQFFRIYIAVVFGGQAAGQFFGYTTSMTKARPAANYILWLRTLKARIGENDSNKGNGPPSGDAEIAVEDLEFSYKQRRARVLKGIDMTIRPGTYAACVGSSGCGKSTLISLLERFYDPTAGSISLGHKNITSMSPRLYREYMSLVQQEPTLYQGSVRENISLGLSYKPTDNEILEACRQANALEFVSSLPEGLSTPCGSKGSQFSGGQRQRIAIARALIRKPRLLLLDEATSALDTQSERIVQQTLDEAAATRTTIAVAHRLSTIQHADIIFVFSDGRIVERGSHHELRRMRGRYYEMCLAQSLDQEVDAAPLTPMKI